MSSSVMLSIVKYPEGCCLGTNASKVFSFNISKGVNCKIKGTLNKTNKTGSSRRFINFLDL